MNRFCCEIELLQTQTYLVCTKCGLCEEYFTDIYDFNTMIKISKYTYQRKNYFAQKIKSMLGKNIPSRKYALLISKIKKIRNLTDLREKMKHYKIPLTYQYYIYNELKHTKIIQLTEMEIVSLKKLFNSFSILYEQEFKENFPKYHFMIMRFAQIIGRTDLKKLLNWDLKNSDRRKISEDRFNKIMSKIKIILN